jgi:hypothetical protein
MREILTGKISAADLRKTLVQRLDTSSAVIDNLARVLTQEFISPHYFQITKLYDQHRREGRSTTGPRDDRPGVPASQGAKTPAIPTRPTLPPAPAAQTPPPGGTRPKNLIDLRETRGGRLPPNLPPAAPRGTLPPTPPPAPRPSPPGTPSTHGPIPPPIEKPEDPSLRSG